MNINIRKSTDLDMPEIYNMVKQLAIYEKEPDAVTATLEDYYRDYADGIFQVLVAEKEKTIIGIAIYYVTYSTWKGKMMYLEDFIVNQNHRRTGVGQLLFDAFIETSKASNARLAKWQVLDWNEMAINFYKKNNAILEKEWLNGKIIF